MHRNVDITVNIHGKLTKIKDAHIHILVVIHMIKLLKLLMGDDSINCAVAAAASVSSVHKHHVQSLKRLNCLNTARQ